MNWEIVIGLETHAQLSTASKIFSGSSTAFGAAPNTQASAVDIALPGVLPVANRGAVERAIRFGLAVNGDINRRSVFARKNYFYPDLPKGYQISQYELPVVQGGEIPITSPTRGKIKVNLTRAHLEEDAGKSLHEDFHGMSGIDLNRAGTPLLEIVSEPEMCSAEEAVAYAKALHFLIVEEIEICDGNMQEGSFRCDANVSVRRPGAPLGTRAEIKNLNSFRFLERAIEFEVKRQIEILENGGKILQETRLYDPDKDETRSMRTKEDAHDYRYFPDPDLLPLQITDEWINEIKASLPARLDALRHGLSSLSKQDALTQRARGSQLDRQFEEQIDRWVEEAGLQVFYGLSDYDAALLTSSRERANYFTQLVKASGVDPKLCANWQNGELTSALKRNEIEIDASLISAEALAKLLKRIVDGTISGKIAKEVFDAMWAGEGNADSIIEKRGLKQISDTASIEKIVDEVLAANRAQVAEYRSGKEKAFNFLVGQAMKASKGKGNPAQINEVLKRRLSG
jgi:aspartyl-tRNA(Asn)/glutamyl-tRNA(Gln) amidotransferase subunit B